MNNINNSMTMRIKALSVNESFARSAVAAFCVQLNPSIEEIGDIKIAVSEAVTNCIVHAYGYGEGEMSITVELYDNTVAITIQDFGKGIEDVDKAMQPFYTSSPEDERSGMGFTVMNAFMDKLEVISESGQGTSVYMEKIVGKEAEVKC
ncbi:MAG: anti-sigma F factor [Clostridia bacterium]|nr:anti-sigma F factor [Clostridia bacterium]